MTDHFRFDCPDCDLEVVVDIGVRYDFLEHGCPICGVMPDPTDFEEVESEEDELLI